MNRVLALGVTSFLLAASPAFAIQSDDSSSAANDRFENDSSFVMNDYDLSGVGRSNDGQ